MNQWFFTLVKMIANQLVSSKFHGKKKLFFPPRYADVCIQYGNVFGMHVIHVPITLKIKLAFDFLLC